MSIFGTIMSKVFGHHGDAPPTAPAQHGSNEATDTSTPASGDTTSAATPASGGGSLSGGGQIDVAKILDEKESHAGQTLDWRHSIVDLMKLLDMDSSLSARKELAHELNYSGDTSDSASMNIWLHKEVMQKFAANGGKLPSDLAH